MQLKFIFITLIKHFSFYNNYYLLHIPTRVKYI